MVASQSGHVEVVQLLLDYEAEINLQSEVTTILHIEMIIVVSICYRRSAKLFDVETQKAVYLWPLSIRN